MRTLGRIFIILAAFAIVMGITYVTVNASTASLSRTAPAFERNRDNGPRLEGERRESRGAGGAVRLLFGFIKNVGIVAVIVALITIPKSLQKRKAAPVLNNKE